MSGGRSARLRLSRHRGSKPDLPDCSSQVVGSWCYRRNEHGRTRCPASPKEPNLTQSNSWPYLLSLGTLFALRLYETTRRHFEGHCKVERPVRPALCSKWRTLADKTGQKPTQCGTGIARLRVSVTIYEVEACAPAKPAITPNRLRSVGPAADVELSHQFPRLFGFAS